MYIEPLQVLTYFGGYPEPQNIPLINPLPANVDNMMSSQQCQQMADGIYLGV